MPNKSDRPNIVFILTDDHAAHAISAYGSRVNQTPQIDRIAADGARLDSCYCTNSICSPSRASILSGTYSHVNGVTSIYSEIDYRVPNFTQCLREARLSNGDVRQMASGQAGRQSAAFEGFR